MIRPVISKSLLTVQINCATEDNLPCRVEIGWWIEDQRSDTETGDQAESTRLFLVVHAAMTITVCKKLIRVIRGNV